MTIGIIFVVLGILIAVYPVLLSIVVAAFLILTGIIFTLMSYHFKKIKREVGNPFLDFFIRF